jgi:alginate O-acetyltransferase complex protein AlgJ
VALTLASIACRERGEDASDARATRVAALERDIAESESHRDAWRGFTDAVLAHREFTCNAEFDCVSADERGAYAPSVLESISDRATLRDRPREAGPLPALVDFARQLREHAIDLLVVVVPAKTTMYPELLGPAPEPSRRSRPDWELRRFMLALEREGIETLDLFDAFVDHRRRSVVDDEGHTVDEKLFRAQDFHWTSYGASVAADAIAARVRQYPWFAEVSSERGRTLTVETVAWMHEGGNAPGVARAITLNPLLHSPAPLEAHALHQVFADGERVAPTMLMDPDSPILVIGDSFVLEHSYSGRRAGLPEHLLRALGFRVDVVAMGHGSPYAARASLPLTRPGLIGKKLVIHEMVAVAPSYRDEWRPVDVFARSTDRGASP